jgi:hypothetical protein
LWKLPHDTGDGQSDLTTIRITARIVPGITKQLIKEKQTIMQINFESLFDLVPTPEDNPTPMLSKDELPGELLEVIREAKLNGVSGSQLVESAIIAFRAESNAATEGDSDGITLTGADDPVETPPPADDGPGITLTGADVPENPPADAPGITLTGADSPSRSSKKNDSR